MDQGEAQRPGRKRETTGELIGSYAVLAQIASGEATTVHLAQKHGALGFHRLAAIKRLKHEFAKRQEWNELLLEEARLSAGVHHTNIVDVIDVGTTSAGCYFVMDYVEGADLEVLLSRAGKERHARYVLPPIVDALHGLHAVHSSLDEDGEPIGMVHQAPRARHILLGIDGTARLTDFSQVHARGLSPSPLRRARLKAAYLSPEQVRGAPIDARTDVFIIGITLWEALTGERLFQAETSEASKRAVLERHIPRPSDVGLRPPRVLDRLCLRALARDPDDRYSDAAEMARALRDTALNEALYATSSELGQWVRALAGRALIERRRAVGADAPSLEIAIDAFESGNLSFAGGQPVEIADSTTSVTPAPEPTSAPPRAGKGTELGVGPVRSPEPAIKGEPSRVTRLYTVAIASPPTNPRVPAADFAPPAMSFLGVSDAPRTADAPVASDGPPTLVDERPPQVSEEPPRGHVQPAAPHARTYESVRPTKPLPGAGSYRHLAADRRAAATLPEGAPRLPQAPAPAQPVAPSEPAPSLWGDEAVHATARELEAAASRSIPEKKNMALARAPWDLPPADAESRAPSAPVPRLRLDDGSLRPPRAAHIDLPDDEEEITSSGGLGFIALLSVAIIGLAGFVGFRQWKAERANDRAGSASSVEASETDPEPATTAREPTVGDRALEPRPGDPLPAWPFAAPSPAAKDAGAAEASSGSAESAPPARAVAPNTASPSPTSTTARPGQAASPARAPVARPNVQPQPAPPVAAERAGGSARPARPPVRPPSRPSTVAPTREVPVEMLARPRPSQGLPENPY